MTRDTVALTMLDGGYKPNVIPERAEAVLDCRLLPDTKTERLPRAAAQDDRRPRSEDRGHPSARARARRRRPTNPLVRRHAPRRARVYPGVVVTESMTTGGTDSRFFRRRGVPAYGFFPVLISKQLTASVHGVDERLPGRRTSARPCG